MSFLSRLDAAKDNTKRVEMFKEELYDVLNAIMDIPEGGLTDDTNLQDAGMDSMMLMKLRSTINELVDERVEVNPNDFTSCYTIQSIAVRLVDVVYETKETMRKRYWEELRAITSRDIVLPDHIKILPGCLPPVPVQKITSIFVTGTTGNMGPYYVQQLSEMPQISRIVCLVRSTRTESGERRLFRRLKELDLLSKTLWEKVEVVEGDLTTDLFGLDPELYDALANSIECILHSGVCSSHLEVYGEGASHSRGVRAVNVEGMLRILEFAVNGRVKSILCPSTIGAVAMKESDIDKKVLKNNMPPEHWPTANDVEYDSIDTAEIDVPNFGYPISKFIADSLTGQAVLRGVPAKAFRYAKIFGDTKHGAFAVTENHFAVKFLYFVKSGVMPDPKVPLQVLPVDTAVKVSLLIFFNPEVGNEMFNMINAHYVTEIDAMKRLTKEYGPLLRVAVHMWEAEEEMKKKGLNIKARGNFTVFLQELKEKVKGEGIDLTPLLELIKKEVPITADVIDNPNLLFKIPKVREFILTNYAYDLECVPNPVFMKHLMSEGPTALLYKWTDFYTRADSPYGRSGKLSEMFPEDVEPEILPQYMEKVLKALPEYNSIMPTSEDVVRQAFEYTLENSMEIFKELLHAHAKATYNLVGV